MKRWIALLLALILLLSGAGLAEEKASVPSDMLRQMTTEQKIAQLLMPAFYYRQNEQGEKVGVQEIYPEMEAVLKEYGFGGVIFNLQNSQENEKALRLVDAVQKASGSVAGRPQLITCTDQEGGYVTRLGRGTMTPGSMALGAVNDPAVTEAAARLIGEEVVAIGYSGSFGPVMDVNNNPSNPVIGIRSFSDDPETVTVHGTAFIRGLHEAGSLSALKHFPGHGDTDTDSHTGLPVVVKSYEQLKDFELVPFQAGIDAGADMVMTAHIVYPLIEKGTYVSKETGEEIGLPATLSKTILTDILRGDMGFSGLIVTDAMNMDAIARHFDVLDAAKLAIEAGVDLILRPVDPFTPDDMAALEQYVRDVAALADEGKISMEAVDAAVLRVLSFKEQHGMLAPYDSGDLEDRIRKAVSVVGSAEHHEQEFEIAKKAVTLLKNENILPLNLPEDKAAVLVPFDSQVMSAEYAVSRLKEEGKIPAETEIPVYSIPSLPAGDLVKVCQENRRIFVVHTAYSAAGMDPAQKAGSSSVLVDAILTLAHAAGNSVIVISAHLPYDTARFPSADALAVCFGARGMSEDPREVGNGVSQYGPNLPAALYLLLGGGEITGTLPVNLPAMDSGCKFTDEVLYPRGTGIRLSPPESPAE